MINKVEAARRYAASKSQNTNLDGIDVAVETLIEIDNVCETTGSLTVTLEWSLLPSFANVIQAHGFTIHIPNSPLLDSLKTDGFYNIDKLKDWCYTAIPNNPYIKLEISWS